MSRAEKTKQKIITAASSLFSCHGYGGTSIRDIAKEADVNLASINYHFINKERLFLETWRFNCNWIDQELAKIGENKSLTTKEFTQDAMKFFLKNGSSLLMIFKLLLDRSVDSTSMEEVDTKYSEAGPPGGDTLYKYINEEVPDHVSEGAKLWAVRIIFGQLIHTGVILSSNWGQSKKKCLNFLQDENIIASLGHVVESTLNYITTNSEKVWEKIY